MSCLKGKSSMKKICLVLRLSFFLLKKIIGCKLKLPRCVCACVSACQQCENFFHYKFKVIRDGTKVELPEHCINWDIAITITSVELYHLSATKNLVVRHWGWGFENSMTKTTVNRNDATSTCVEKKWTFESTVAQCHVVHLSIVSLCSSICSVLYCFVLSICPVTDDCSLSLSLPLFPWSVRPVGLNISQKTMCVCLRNSTWGLITQQDAGTFMGPLWWTSLSPSLVIRVSAISWCC